MFLLSISSENLAAKECKEWGTKLGKVGEGENLMLLFWLFDTCLGFFIPKHMNIERYSSS